MQSIILAIWDSQNDWSFLKKISMCQTYIDLSNICSMKFFFTPFQPISLKINHQWQDKIWMQISHLTYNLSSLMPQTHKNEKNT